MAASITFYNSFREYLADGTIDLDTHTFKVLLTSSSYTPSTAHTTKADMRLSPIFHQALTPYIRSRSLAVDAPLDTRLNFRLKIVACVVAQNTSKISP